MMDELMVYRQLEAEFLQREEERTAVREKLETIIVAIDRVEMACKDLSVFGSEERYRLGQAKLAILEGLRSIDRAANTVEERNCRSTQDLRKRIA